MRRRRDRRRFLGLASPSGWALPSTVSVAVEAGAAVLPSASAAVSFSWSVLSWLMPVSLAAPGCVQLRLVKESGCLRAVQTPPRTPPRRPKSASVPTKPVVKRKTGVELRPPTHPSTRSARYQAEPTCLGYPVETGLFLSSRRRDDPVVCPPAIGWRGLRPATSVTDSHLCFNRIGTPDQVLKPLPAPGLAQGRSSPR